MGVPWERPRGTAWARRTVRARDFGPGMGVVRRIVLMFVSRENSLKLQWRCKQCRGPSTAVDLRACARRSILAQDDKTLETIPSLSVPANWRFVQVDVYLLGFQVLFDAPGAEFAAETGLLVASPRRFDIGGLHVVDPDDACAQCFHGAHGLKDVAGPDGSGEAVGGVVGDLERV